MVFVEIRMNDERSQDLSSAELSAREQEAFELSRVAMMLDVARNESDQPALAAALEANMEIWIGIRALILRAKIDLPKDTGENLVRLSGYVAETTLNHGVEMPPHVLDTLININLQISEGLLEGMAP